MVFSQADAKMRTSLYKLRITWDGVFPADTLLVLDTLVNDKDPGWPVPTPSQPITIHINPDFIKGGSGRRTAVKGDLMKERILQEQKVLLELQKKKVELEMLQTEQVLEMKQKKLASITRDCKPPTVTPESRNLQSVERAHPTEKAPQATSSFKDTDVDNSKKLLELSNRDPRRKTRQPDLAGSSPLSGTSSPVPSRPVRHAEPVSSSSSPYMDFSDDSRDRPPTKKSKNKEKKSRRDKELSRDKKSYKPKVPDGSKNNNGIAYKPLITNRQEYEDMETAVESILPSNSSKKLVDVEMSSTSDRSSNDPRLSSQNIVKRVVEPSKSSLDSVCDKTEAHHIPENNEIVNHPVDVDIRQSVETSLSELFETGRPTIINLRSRDPRLAETNRTSGTKITDSPVGFNLDDKLPLTSVPGHSQAISEISKSSNSNDSSDVNSLVDSSQKTDLISSLSNSESIERKKEMEIIDSPSHDSVSFDGKSIDSNILFQESDKEPGLDFGSKTASSKRKCDPDDDKESHKKILLSQLEGEDSPNEIQPVAVSCPTNFSETKPVELEIPLSFDKSASPPLVAPPAPIISSLVSTKSESTNQLMVSDNDSNEEVNPVITPSLVTTEESGKDVDLRLLLPRPLERTKEEVKVETHEVEPITLFGGEDVDYRQKPPQAEFNLPSPPPPPMIGNLQEAAGKKSWAQIKDRKSEERFPSPKVKMSEERFLLPKIRPDRTKRSSLSSQSKSNSSNKEVSRQNSHEHCNLLIKEAEEQLRNGNITFVEYNKMLQEVVSINEERILKEARARYSNTPVTPDDESGPASPLSENNSFELERSDQLGESKSKAIHLETNVTEPALDRLSNVNENKLVNQPLEKRPMEPPPPIAHMPQFPTDAPFGGDLERDRFNFPDSRVWGAQSSLAPNPNVIENFPIPPGLPRGLPLPQFPPFPPPNMPFQPGFRPRMPRDIAPRTFLPQVDMDLLIDAESNRMESIAIGGSTKQVRFYGMTAVVLQSWDDPREVRFPPGKRRLLIDQRHEFMLHFGDAPVDITIDGMTSFVQLGAPGREIYIDNKYYSMSFGGIPFEVLICGRVRSLCLPGPPPVVSFSPLKRTDLVAGSVNLYINAKSSVSFFLDATPQKFYIGREPCVLQFADSLMTVLMNSVPVPLEFGGFPVPIMVKGELHFLRLTCLPIGIIPGQIEITNMMSFAHPAPSLQPLPIPPVIESTPAPSIIKPPQVSSINVVQQPLDLLANIISSPALTAAADDRSYTVEQPTDTALSEDTQTSISTTSDDGNKNININDLFQKLLMTGLLHSAPKDPPEEKKKVVVVETDADFIKPESLKCARPSLITKLYSGIQCSSCGIRFPPEGTKMYSRHLDWHFRQNRREKHSTRKPQSRNWYYSYSNWLQYQELDDIDENEPDNLEEELDDDSEEDIPSVPVGRRKNVACQVCGETFEEFFDHETEEWQARNAIMVEDLFYHPLCYEEFKTKKDAGPPESEEKIEEEDEGPPLDDPSTVEVIDLDETEVPSPLSSHDGETLPLIGPDKAESPDIIAVDDTSDSKSSVNEVKLDDISKDTEGIASDDDDILDIIPIERKIDTYDLIDDDDDDKIEKIDETINLDDKSDTVQEEKEEEFDFTKVTIKQEKDRLVVENVDSSLPTYTATIDGNIVHETAVQPVVPGRIKINIHRSKQNDGDNIEPSNDSNDGLALNQPMPPGEDIIQPPQSIKPKLEGVDFTPQPLVSQGSELSGLCSIM